MEIPTWSEIDSVIEKEYPNRYSVIVVAFDLGGIGSERWSGGRYPTLKLALRRGNNILKPDRPMRSRAGMPTSDSCDYFFIFDDVLGETVYSQVEITDLRR